MEDYIAKLKEYNQEHILDYINMASDEQKQNLINEINEIDFEDLKNIYETCNKLNDDNIKENKIEHISYVDEYKLDKDSFTELSNSGKKIIKNNEYAVVTMAGGQGTRLDFDGPKGTFLLDVKPSPKYLFEIICDNLKRVNFQYGIILNWYIMTSTENNEQTVKFFDEHNYFDYPKDHIKFFTQGNMPVLSEDGKLMVDINYNIKIAADGNGCIYKSMKKDGILDDMKNKGIKWIFIGSVDNVLLNMCDPVLLGLAIKENNQIASKSIVKRDPHERVGVFCKKNSKPSVIEYSELPEDMAELKDENGELVFGESHIMCNLYSIEALEKISNIKLPYHKAHKKIKYLDLNGTFVNPTEPNAYKYEAFIFDGFNYFDDISILRGKRENDFAPVKNREGQDSPETATILYNSYHGF